MGKVKKENFIVIQGWMLTELNLKGNELIVYAIIYGFTQNGDGQHYTGSLQYLADWTNSTKRSVMNNLKTLMEKRYIEKVEIIKNGVKFCEYFATNFNSGENFSIGSENFSQEKAVGGENFSIGSEKSSPNNIVNIINSKNNIKDNNIETPDSENPVSAPSKPSKPTKHKYGEYNHVLLTDDELTKLHNDFGEIMTNKAITYLDEYIEMKGYKAKSHYLAIRKWVVDAVKEQDRKKSRNQEFQNGQSGRLDWIDNIDWGDVSEH